MKTKQMVFTALFMAIVFVMGLWPQLGFIQIVPTVQVTIIHIPVIIGSIFLGSRSGALIGLAFGISSFVNSMSSGVLFAPVFANPLVSILPRIIFGWSVHYIYTFFKMLFKNKEALSYALSAGVATLFHSLMVVPLLYVFGLNNPGIANVISGQSIFAFIGAILFGNALLEIAASVVIAPIILAALNRIQP